MMISCVLLEYEITNRFLDGIILCILVPIVLQLRSLPRGRKVYTGILTRSTVYVSMYAAQHMDYVSPLLVSQM